MKCTSDMLSTPRMSRAESTAPESSHAVAASPVSSPLASLHWLTELARKKSGVLPPELVAAHVLAVTPEADWQVQRAALEAILRRILIVDQEKLKVVERPPKGGVLGSYAIRAAGGRRPYRTVLLDVVPLQGSCDCADFVRNSLGLCKHILAVMSDAVTRQARRKKPLPQTLPAGWPALRLAWGPVRPLNGPGDWLVRVQAIPHAPAALRQWFIEDTALLRSAFSKEPEKRLALVKALLAQTEKEPHAVAVDPALRPLLHAELERLKRREHGSQILHRVPELLRGLKHKLYPYQRKGVTRAIAEGRLLLADDMGLGKTAQAIATCQVLWKAKRVKRGLLIVPASLKAQWLREWTSFTDVPLTIVEGGPLERAAFYEAPKTGFLVANYEQVMRDLPIMQAWKPDIVVLDEAQRIKNWETKTAMAVKALQPTYRLVLTGTPMENRLDELASLMDWVDSFTLEPKWRLSPWHIARAEGSHDAIGARNLDTLRERLSPFMLRRRRSEVLTELPSRTDTRVPVELTPEQLGEHEELNLPISRLVSISHKRPLKQEEFLRLMQLLTRQRMLCNGVALAHFDEMAPRLEKTPVNDAVLGGLATPKLRELRELIANVVVAQDQKVVIFSQWRRMLVLANWAVSDILAKAKVRGVFFSGEESLKKRAQNLVDLHEDPQTKVLFATDAGGVGLNLQKALTCCINLELPWNPAVLEQRIGRIYRNGQKHPVEIYNLVSEGGIEARIADLVADKKALFTGLFDGTTDEVKFDGSGSFLARVEKLLEIQAVPPEATPQDGEELADVVEKESDEASEPEAPPIIEAAAEPAPAPTPEEAQPPVELPAAATPSVVTDVRALLSSVHVQMTPTGGLTIHAPREAAASLAALFSEFARKLSEVGPSAGE
jgi:hypothetical protein